MPACLFYLPCDRLGVPVWLGIPDGLGAADTPGTLVARFVAAVGGAAPPIARTVVAVLLPHVVVQLAGPVGVVLAQTALPLVCMQAPACTHHSH